MDWNERLSKLADNLEKAASSGVDFMSAEIPLYIQELLYWEFVSGITEAMALSIVVSILAFVGRLLYKKAIKQHHEQDQLAFGVLSFLFYVGAMLVCMLVFSKASNAIKVKVAPRVVITEKIAELSKKQLN